MRYEVDESFEDLIDCFNNSSEVGSQLWEDICYFFSNYEKCVENYEHACSEEGELFELQSADITVEQTDNQATTGQTDSQVNVGFDESVEQITVMTPNIPSAYSPTTTTDAEISKFLNRPVNIVTTAWTVGGAVDTSFAPWNLFFDHDSIRRKLDNYAFIRCDLHLKIVLNASPFYYSAVMASYLPLHGFYNSAPTSGTSLVAFSQRPHVYVYPQNSQGAEMILPYMWPYEWLNITSAADTTSMGRIYMDSMVNLLAANASTTPITIQVYAWAENVVLSGLTVGLAVQSDDFEVQGGDEYHRGKGPLSKPASAIARATGSLSDVPVIGSFMTATSMVANKVANIFSIFGYSKVPVIDNPLSVKNLPFRGFASADIADVTEKLTVDCKNELSINPTLMGLEDKDPLIISNFVARESYLTQFTWLAADTAGTLLWNIWVNPTLAVGTSAVDQTVLEPTPMWVPSQCFTWWRGDIIYNFKVICSKFHRGRLRISWDPVGDIGNTNDSSTEVYTQIVDICDGTNVSIRVPYMQSAAYLYTETALGTVNWDVDPLPVDTGLTVNGILSVRVLTEQSSPQTVAPINVLVSVRGAENLEFAGPKDVSDDIYFFTVQSADVVGPVDNTMAEVEYDSLGGESTTDPNINLVYMGEKVVSMRSLLMRTHFLRMSYFDLDHLVSKLNKAVYARRPMYRGYDTNGINYALGLTVATAHKFNFVKNTPYHLTSSCFLGERGSFTWNYNLDNVKDTSVQVTRDRIVLTSANYGNDVTSLINTETSTLAANACGILTSGAGAVLMNQKTNAGLSFNAPMYSQAMFLDTSPSKRVVGLDDISNKDSMVYTKLGKVNLADDADSLCFESHWFNVGPDYMPVFFLNVPSVYIYDSTPVADSPI